MNYVKTFRASRPGVVSHIMKCLLVAMAICGIGARAASSSAATPMPSALALHPSENFEGDDGFWSTFAIEIGTPPQVVRLLPSTSAFAGTAVWAVIDEGCWEANPGLTNCEDRRGGTFIRNQSSTWSTSRLQNGGLYELETLVEGELNLTGAAYYGFDTVNLGINGEGLPTLTNLLVAGMATDNFWLGTLGLSPKPLNFTTLNDPIPSMLGTLVSQGIVSSASWAYTAGAFYADPPVYGSLTFGGYDQARINGTSTLHDIDFSGNNARDLVVRLQTITYNSLGSSPLQSESIDIFIDSLVPELWLPQSTCDQFEKAFNLTWNASVSAYTLDDAVHGDLVAQNPVFTFSLGTVTGNETIDIVMSYAAFDLNLTLPTLSHATRYFPLKRAQNETEYTLGRVFLQAAYVIADYDRQNFTVTQATLLPPSTKQELVSICAPGNESTCTGHRNSSGLSTGAIAGIVVGAVLGLSIILLGLVWWIMMRTRKKHDKAAEDAAQLSAMDGKSLGTDPDSNAANHNELEGAATMKHELALNVQPMPELDAPKASRQRYELDEAGDRMHRREAQELPTDQLRGGDPADLAGRRSPVELEASAPTLSLR